MATIKINPEFKDEVIGFNNSGLPLGERSDADLRALAIRSYSSKALERFFTERPTLKQLQDMKGDEFLDKTPALPAPNGK